jgi:hypothetical protein
MEKAVAQTSELMEANGNTDRCKGSIIASTIVVH